MVGGYICICIFFFLSFNETRYVNANIMRVFTTSVFFFCLCMLTRAHIRMCIFDDVGGLCGGKQRSWYLLYIPLWLLAVIENTIIIRRNIVSMETAMRSNVFRKYECLKGRRIWPTVLFLFNKNNTIYYTLYTRTIFI